MTEAFGRMVSENGEIKLANLVTLSRAALIFPILFLIHAQLLGPALMVYLIASITDVFDGWLARRARRASSYGARLDAIVDNVFALGILFFLVASYPGLFSRHGLALGILFGGPLFYLIVSWLLTGHVLMFHFWSAKVGAFLLFALWPILQLSSWEGFVPIAATVVGLSRLEQIVFILRGGREQDAPHVFARVEAP
jgi:phosphatidylglycerophosphate synthase